MTIVHLPGTPERAAIERDLARLRAELRDRVDRVNSDDLVRALCWLATEQPDLVNEALDETGAPQ